MNNKKTEVIDKISELMKVTGYAGTSIFDMAKSCNMSKASIYHYFDSKEAVLEFVIKRAIQLENIDLLIQLGVELGAGPYESAMQMIRVYLDSVYSSGKFLIYLIFRLGLRVPK